MTLDESTLASLRAVGGMIGETNLASWQELVEVFKPEGVSWGMAKARREFDTRQVTATQVAKALRHNLKCHEPERKNGDPIGATPPIAKPPLQQIEQEAPTERRQFGVSTGRKGIDYVQVVARIGSGYLSDVARAAGVCVGTPGPILKRLVRNGKLETFTNPGAKRERYRVPAGVAKSSNQEPSQAFNSHAPAELPQPRSKSTVPINKAAGILGEIGDEIDRASANFKPFNSAHEGYAVLLEEVDELWDEVKKKQSARDYAAMHRECVQIAAMAARLIADVCMSGNRGHEKRSA